MLGRKILQTHIRTTDYFDEHWPSRHLPTDEVRIATNVPRTNDRDGGGVPSIKQRTMSFDPSAFPAHVDHRVIVQVGTAEEGRSFREAQDSVGLQFERSEERRVGKSVDLGGR